MSLFDSVFKNDIQLEEEYRRHLENLKIQQVMEVEQRRIDKLQQQSMYNSMLGMGAQKPIRPLPRFDPNKSEAFHIPLSQAVTMWQVKYGDKWFDGHQARPEDGKDFYADVFARLRKADLFEDIDGWYRLKEDACL